MRRRPLMVLLAANSLALVSGCSSRAAPLSSGNGPDAKPDTAAADGAPAVTSSDVRPAQADAVPLADVPPTQSASLSIDRSIVDLGTLDVGATGMAVVGVSNSGSDTSGPISVTPSSGITVTGCSGPLPASASCTLTIVATPTEAGAFAGTVTITANPGTVTPLVVTVSATVSGGLLVITPTSIELGNVPTGKPAPQQTITIAAASALSGLAVAASGAEVSIDPASTCTSFLAAGASCAVVVNFTAATSGMKSDAIVISVGGGSGRTVTVPITAVAQNPATLLVGPSTSQAFSAPLGQSSSPVTFWVTNVGDVATGAITVAVVGAGAKEFAVTSQCLMLAPAATCTISVVFTPTAMDASAVTASLTVTDSGSDASPVAVPLSGALCSEPAPIITSAGSDWGTVWLFSPYLFSTDFHVANGGDTATGALSVSVSSSEFAITNDTCSGVSLPPGGTCTVSIAFHPTTVGAKTATLTVTGTSCCPAVKTLTGTGATPPELTATPAAIDFGNVAVGETGAAQTVTIKNIGASSTGVLSLTGLGSDYAVFPISANTCTAALAPGATCSFALQFSPTAVKGYAAGFSINDLSSFAGITVSGIGI